MQQPLIGVLTHWFVIRLHTSIVQTFMSLHSGFVMHAASGDTACSVGASAQPNQNAIATQTQNREGAPIAAIIASAGEPG